MVRVVLQYVADSNIPGQGRLSVSQEFWMLSWGDLERYVESLKTFNPGSDWPEEPLQIAHVFVTSVEESVRGSFMLMVSEDFELKWDRTAFIQRVLPALGILDEQLPGEMAVAKLKLVFRDGRVPVEQDSPYTGSIPRSHSPLTNPLMSFFRWW